METVNVSVVAEVPAASVTITRTPEFPAEVGVPDMTPVLELSAKPAGRVPLAKVNDLSPDCPEVVTVSENARFKYPVRPVEGVVTESADLTVKESPLLVEIPAKKLLAESLNAVEVIRTW